MAFFPGLSLRRPFDVLDCLPMWCNVPLQLFAPPDHPSDRGHFTPSVPLQGSDGLVFLYEAFACSQFECSSRLTPPYADFPALPNPFVEHRMTHTMDAAMRLILSLALNAGPHFPLPMYFLTMAGPDYLDCTRQARKGLVSPNSPSCLHPYLQ